MKHIISIILLLSFTCSYAQRFQYFQAEEVNYYKTFDKVNSGDLWFYDQPDGGHLIHKATTQANTTYTFALNNELRPAFMLNRTTLKVTPLEDLLFSIKNIQLNESGLGSKVQFESFVSNVDDLYFVIKASNDLKEYTVLDTICALNSKSSTLYISRPVSSFLYYKLEVVSKQNGLQYSSIDLSSAKLGLLYPNICSNKFYVSLTQDNIKMNIYNTAGTNVYSKILTSGNNTVAVDQLPNGSYTVRLSNKNQTQCFALIKQ